jgi:hypothetical protein
MNNSLVIIDTGMDWTHKAPIKLCDRSFAGIMEAEGQEVCTCMCMVGEGDMGM